jgi:hypothetical protein
MTVKNLKQRQKKKNQIMNRQPTKLHHGLHQYKKAVFLLPMAIGTPSEIDTFAMIDNNF